MLSSATPLPGFSPDDASPGGPGFEVKRNGRGRFDLKIWGKFPPGWLGHLAFGLTGNCVSILQGTARRISPSVWQAAIEISPTETGVDPAAIDYLGLISQASKPTVEQPVRLSRFHLERLEGALSVDIDGTDQVGFLGALLRIFAFYSLFPTEMVVDTQGHTACDRFLLKGMGGTAPSEAVIQALREKFEALVEAR